MSAVEAPAGSTAREAAQLLEVALSGAFLRSQRANADARAAAGKARAGVLTASALGGCRRRAAYALAGAEHEPVVSEARQAWLGTWQHQGLLPALADALGSRMHSVLLEQPIRVEVAGVPVLGSADLYTHPTVVDLKTVGEHGLARVPQQGVQRTHRMQTTAYALGLAEQGLEVEQRAIVYLDRASGEHRIRVEPVEEADVDEVEAWVTDVAGWASTDCEDAPRDERGPGLSIICDGCPFLRRCWGPDATPGATGPQRLLRGDGAEAAPLALYADAHAREKQAKEDKAFAAAVLEGLPPGVYGAWQHKTRRPTSFEEVDVKAAVAALQAAGLGVPMRTATRAGYTLPPAPAS